MNNVMYMRIIKDKLMRELSRLRSIIPSKLSSIDKAKVMIVIESDLNRQIHCVPTRGQDRIEHIEMILQEWTCLNIHQLPDNWKSQLQGRHSCLFTDYFPDIPSSVMSYKF